MVQINFAQKSVTVKIVYYGPGMSGKTTNLEVVHQRAPENSRGDLTSISTDGDRTLFFDFMPLDLGTVAGMKTQFQIYTVPGQVYYNSTRKLVLQGVDGVIFIADSSASMMEENLESLRNLQENLTEYGKDMTTMPMVIQYNKRDLPDALPVPELEAALNPAGRPSFEGVANTGQGVFPTLKALASLVLDSIHEQAGGSGGRDMGAAAPQVPAASMTPPAPGQAPGIGSAEVAPAASVPEMAPQPLPEPQPEPMAPPAFAAAASAPEAPVSNAPEAPIGAAPESISMTPPAMELPVSEQPVSEQPVAEVPLETQAPLSMAQPAAEPLAMDQQPISLGQADGNPQMQSPELQQTGFTPAEQASAPQQPQASVPPQPQSMPQPIQMQQQPAQPQQPQPVQMQQQAPAQPQQQQQQQQPASGLRLAEPVAAAPPSTAPAQPSAASLMEVAPSVTAAPPPASSASLPSASPRIKPRQAALATPASGRKSAMITGAFVTLALAAGVAIGGLTFGLF